MATLGTAYVQILPSASGMGAALSAQVGAAAAPAGKTGGAILGSAMGKMITAAGIGLAIKKSVEEGARLEQALGGVETLYKEHAQTVIKNANNAYRTAGLSANEYMEQSTMFAAALLQSLGGDTAAAAKYADMAITDMADNANKFGTSIQDIQNAYQGFSKQNYTMLDNLKLGYGGTKSEMERLLADAEKLSGVEYDISNLSDVYDAIHVIQQEMGVTGTTAEEASKTLAGSFASMKSAASNFLASMSTGENVSGAMSGLVTSVTTFLFDNLIPAVVTIGASLPTALFEGVKVGIPLLIAKIPSLIEQIFTGAASFINTVTEYITEFVDAIANDPNTARSMAEAGLELLRQLGLAFVRGYPQLQIAFAKLIWAIIKSIPALAGAAFRGIDELTGGKLSEIVETVRTKFAEVKEALVGPIREAKEKLATIINKIKAKFDSVKLKLKLKVPKISLSAGKAPWGIGGKGKLPKISVTWAAKGGIVDGATLIGAGEKGAEAIVPLTPFWNKMDTIADRIASGVNAAMAGGVATSAGNVTVVTYLYPSGPKMDEYTYKSYERGKAIRRGR